MKSYTLRLPFFLRWVFHWLLLWFSVAAADSFYGWLNSDPQPERHFWELFTTASEAGAWFVMVGIVEITHRVIFRRYGFWWFLCGVLAAVAAVEGLAVLIQVFRAGPAAYSFLPVGLLGLYAAGYELVNRLVRFAQMGNS